MSLISDLIRGELKSSREADPRDIARVLMRKIRPGDLRTLVEEMLVDRVRLEITRMRMGGPPTSSVGTSKWDRYKRDLRYNPGGVWKLFGDLTAEDCELLADEAHDRAIAALAMEDKWVELAATIRRAGVTRVSELPSGVPTPA